MKIKVKLWLLREINRRNEEHIRVYREKRQPPSQPRQEKPMWNRDKPRKPAE